MAVVVAPSLDIPTGSTPIIPPLHGTMPESACRFPPLRCTSPAAKRPRVTALGTRRSAPILTLMKPPARLLSLGTLLAAVGFIPQPCHAALQAHFKLDDGAVDPNVVTVASAVSSHTGSLAGGVLPTWSTAEVAPLPASEGTSHITNRSSCQRTYHFALCIDQLNREEAGRWPGHSAHGASSLSPGQRPGSAGRQITRPVGPRDDHRCLDKLVAHKAALFLAERWKDQFGNEPATLPSKQEVGFGLRTCPFTWPV